MISPAAVGCKRLSSENGIPVQMKVSVPEKTRYVRLIIYDYVVDLMGMASKPIG